DTSTLPGTLGDDIRQSYDPDGTLDSTSMLTLDLNGAGTEVVDDLDQDFGYLPLGTIGDTIWYDTNNDGVQDAGELGIAGVTVQLTPPADVDLGAGLGQPVTMVTDSDGHYLFENLPVGAYQVDVISGLAPEFIQSGDPDGTLDNHSDVTLALNPSDPTEVIGNLDQDFGYVEPVSIGGYLWEDLDGDGLQEANEPAIAGSSVTLLMDDGTGTFIPAVDFDGNPVAPITVGQTGQYLFDNLPNGDFKVRVTKPAGLLPTPVQNAADNDDAEDDSNSASEPIVDTFESGVFTLLGGTEPVEANTFSGDDQDDAATAVARDESGNMTVDFGFVPLASIGNRVWLDLDKDGVQDANEDGIAGVTVTLFEDTDGDGIPETAVQTAITGPNGEYLFPDLDPGVAYQVFVDSASLPPSLEQTFDEGPTPGVSGPLDHSSDIIVLTPNEEHLT
ncbi:MAG: hypothetical protein KAG66_08400, partial [Methylococcales bacterium]|nr:hypothetical protein [Methylococcales bacterium]